MITTPLGEEIQTNETQSIEDIFIETLMKEPELDIPIKKMLQVLLIEIAANNCSYCADCYDYEMPYWLWRLWHPHYNCGFDEMRERIDSL